MLKQKTSCWRQWGFPVARFRNSASPQLAVLNGDRQASLVPESTEPGAFTIDIVALFMTRYTRIPRISIGLSGEVKRRIRKLMPAPRDVNEACLAGHVPRWTL